MFQHQACERSVVVPTLWATIKQTATEFEIASAKTPREAKRCHKRQLADHVRRVMIADERRREATLREHSGATLQSGATGSTPTTSSSDKSLSKPANCNSTTSHPAA